MYWVIERVGRIKTHPCKPMLADADLDEAFDFLVSSACAYGKDAVTTII